MGRRPSKLTIFDLRMITNHIPNNGGFVSLSALSTSSGLSFSKVKKAIELIEFVQTHLSNDLSLGRLGYLSGLDSDFQKGTELIKFVEDVPKILISRATSGHTTIRFKEQEEQEKPLVVK